MYIRNVLHIIADGNAGGGTTVVLGLCEDLIASGNFKITLITQPNSYALRCAQELGIEVLPFDFFTSRFDRYAPSRLLTLTEQIQPDLIHVHGSRAAFPFCFAPLKKLHHPLIYTVHGYHFRLKKGPLKWLGWLAERQIVRRCRFLTWVSQGDKAIAARWHLTPPDRNTATVIYNGIYPGDFTDIESQATHYDLVFAGRLDIPKNPLFMIDILACLKDRPVSLLMIGGGQLEKQLHTYAKEKGVSQFITFSGALSHEETLRALNAARIAVMPSLWEGFPILPLEAGYLGLPVVAAAIPGVDEIIKDGQNGYLIPSHDAELYASAIKKLLDNSTLMQEMGGRSKHMVKKNFLRRQNTEKFIDLYCVLSSHA